jgi:hypothetical protein
LHDQYEKYYESLDVDFTNPDRVRVREREFGFGLG